MGRAATLSVLALTLLAGACASTQRATGSGRGEPSHFLVLDRGVGLDVVVGDERELLDEALKAAEASDWPRARRVYDALLADLPDSTWRDIYAYNRGLIAMALEDHRAAAQDFQAAATWARAAADRRDSLLHLAIARAGQGHWREAADLLEGVLSTEDRPARRVELRTRAGICRQQIHDWVAAERHYRAAVRLQQESADLYLRHHPEWAARAQYQIGDAYAERFGELSLRLPLDRMGRDLDEKARLLLKAQNAFLQAIRLRDATWALAAGYRVGELYERFYQDLESAEVPDDLDDEGRAIYFDELRRRIAPVLKRAAEVYRKNLEMAARIGARNEWIERTEAGLRKVEALVARLPAEPAAPGSPTPVD